MITQGVIDELKRKHAKQLHDFVELFHRWNKKINLSAARSPEEIREHVEDCLHVVPFLADTSRVLDVGSGGGFPVVLAAICAPNIEFVSLEPVHKKQAFLKTAARELGLRIEARAERIEDHEGREYDVAMSRATFDIVEWFARAKTFVRVGGSILGFEGVERDDLQVERVPYGTLKARSIVRLRV